MEKIDTSIEGFKYAGINLTEEQFDELIALNIQMQCHPEIPVFNTIMLLKVLNLLPAEMIDEASNNQGGNNFNKNSKEWFERRYGKRIDRCIT